MSTLRIDNLKAILSIIKPGELAALVGRKAAYFPQIIKNGHVPDRTIQAVEACLHLPSGALDTELDLQPLLGDLRTLELAGTNTRINMEKWRADLLELAPWGEMIAYRVQDNALAPMLFAGDLCVIGRNKSASETMPTLLCHQAKHQLRYVRIEQDQLFLQSSALQRGLFPDQYLPSSCTKIIGPVIWRSGKLPVI